MYAVKLIVSTFLFWSNWAEKAEVKERNLWKIFFRHICELFTITNPSRYFLHKSISENHQASQFQGQVFNKKQELLKCLCWLMGVRGIKGEFGHKGKLSFKKQSFMREKYHKVVTPAPPPILGMWNLFFSWPKSARKISIYEFRQFHPAECLWFSLKIPYHLKDGFP